MPDIPFEGRIVHENPERIQIEATVAGYPVLIEQFGDSVTSLEWELPEGDGLGMFLASVKDAVEHVEDRGYDDPEPLVVTARSGDAQVVTGPYAVPLEADDLRELGVDPDDVETIVIGKEFFTTFVLERRVGRVGVMFERGRPHHSRAAFHFMAGLVPRMGVSPQDISQFVLGLPVIEE